MELMKVAMERSVEVKREEKDIAGQCVPFLVKINVHCVEFEHWMSVMKSIGARVDGVESKFTKVSSDVDGLNDEMTGGGEATRTRQTN